MLYVRHRLGRTATVHSPATGNIYVHNHVNQLARAVSFLASSESSGSLLEPVGDDFLELGRLVVASGDTLREGVGDSALVSPAEASSHVLRSDLHTLALPHEDCLGLRV